MAFVKTKPKLRAGRGRTDAVSMGVYLADGKDVERKSVTFRFSSSVLDKLGWKPVDGKPFFVNVLEGTDTDTGFLQLAPDVDGYSVTGKTAAPENSVQSRSITVGIDRFQHYVLNEPGPVPSAPVQYVIDGDTMLIECPDWLRFNPLSVPQPEPVVAPHQTHVSREDHKAFEELMKDTRPLPPPRSVPKLVQTNASAGAVPMHVRGKGRKHVR
jgi:hypothetical protein